MSCYILIKSLNINGLTGWQTLLESILHGFGPSALGAGDTLFKTLYPAGITGKWVEAGRSQTKNWLCIERARQAK